MTYAVTYRSGFSHLISFTSEAQLRLFLRDRQPYISGVGLKGGNLPQYTQVLEPISGTNAADGPWITRSYNADGTSYNYTLALANPNAAIDQAKTDGSAILTAAGATPKRITIVTEY